MSEATPRPWKAEKRNWRNEHTAYDWYIRGDIHEPDDMDEIGSATAVAIVVGNATAGEIPRLTAELIVRAANRDHLFDELVATLKDNMRDGSSIYVQRVRSEAKAVLAKVEAAKEASK